MLKYAVNTAIKKHEITFQRTTNSTTPQRKPTLQEDGSATVKHDYTVSWSPGNQLPVKC